MKTFDLKPQLFDTLKSYNKKNFMSDLMAGIIVGIVALPLAIAFGIASGVTPEKGIITAIVAGFLVSLLGGSKVQIGGPTGAFIVIIYGIIQKYGIEGLTIATIMAGVFLILFGLLKHIIVHFFDIILDLRCRFFIISNRILCFLLQFGNLVIQSIMLFLNFCFIIIHILQKFLTDFVELTLTFLIETFKFISEKTFCVIKLSSDLSFPGFKL